MKLLQKIQVWIKSLAVRNKTEEPMIHPALKKPDASAILNRTAQPYHTRVVLPTQSIPTIHYFMNTNPNIAYRFIVRRVSNAVKHNWPMVELYIVGSNIAAVARRDYEEVLTKAVHYFTAVNDTKNAKRCKKLIDKHKVNLIIDSTNKN